MDKVRWDRQDIVAPKGARTALFCMVNEAYAPLSRIVMPNFKEYCEKQGYYLRLYAPGFFLDDATPTKEYGDKIKFTYYYDLRGHFERVMYLDIDSIIVNMNLRVEPLAAVHSFLWTYGEDGPLSGFFIACTDETTQSHLRYAYQYAANNNNVRHDRIEPRGISDQDAMTALMNIPPFSSTFGNCVAMESIGLHFTDTEEPQPWIVTCRGGSIETKCTQVAEWIQKRQSAKV